MRIADALSFDLFQDRHTRVTRHFPAGLRRVAQRKLQYLNAAATLQDLRSPPGNRLEALVGNLAGYHSISKSTIDVELFSGGKPKAQRRSELLIIIRGKYAT